MDHKHEPEQGRKLSESDPFIGSLHSLKPADIDQKAAPKRAGTVLSRLIRWGALLLCVAVLVASLASVAASLVDYKVADDYYDGLSDLWGNLDAGNGNPFGPAALADKSEWHAATPEYGTVISAGDSGGADQTDADSELMLQIRAKLNALKVQNSDLLGWISVPDTKIDYPVVHTVDNEYYLNHAFDRTYLRAGAIFADYRNKKDLSKNYNTVIYGHNMSSGAMFSCISDFFSRSYFNENRYIYIYTENGIYVYKTFSIRKVRVDKDVSYITTYFATGEDFVKFCNDQMKASAVKVDDVTFNENDKIITLSTCTNAHNSNERYCMQAVLVEIQK
ncbi:MAG: class B sortase [Clostridia bacterium]|nr:class B sortase [Clostridia bacterium]